MAVGWWAKSSMMVMPSISARTSRRRRTLRKVAEGLDDGLGGNSLPGGERGGSGGIEGVVFAGHRQREVGPGFAGAEDAPVARAVFEVQIGEAPGGVGSESVTFDVTESVAHALGDILAAVEGDDAAAARDKVHQPLEG